MVDFALLVLFAALKYISALGLYLIMDSLDRVHYDLRLRSNICRDILHGRDATIFFLQALHETLARASDKIGIFRAPDTVAKL